MNHKKTINQINRLISSTERINLEIGSGPKKGKRNWITLDICKGSDITFDLLKGIPFPDSSVDMIYSSHLLEHFYYKDLLFLLGECHRVLKKGGCFSACVPDATIYIKEYLNPGKLKPKQIYEPAFYINSSIDYINYIAYMNGNHKYMFDENNMITILNNIGFNNSEIREFNPELDDDIRHWESLYFVAYK